MPPPRLVLWDWDNTLVDGWAAIEAGLNAAFAAFGLPTWSRAEVLGNVRRALRESFPELFGADWERARDIFYAEVRRQHLAVLTPMPGAAAALGAVAAAGLRQGVISNKQGPLLRAEAAHLGWEGHFGALVGAGDAAADTRIETGGDDHRVGAAAGPDVWYVGDTAMDMQAARAAGCLPVLLGDAGHDGGVAAAAPALQFADGAALARHVCAAFRA